MASGKGQIEPKSCIDPEFGRNKKVFIAYAHNPDQYEVYVPPCRPEKLLHDPNTLRTVLREKQEHEVQQRTKIHHHVSCIERLARYMSSLGVTVVYDGYWKGKMIQNQILEFKQQISDSDFVLLIITPSLNHYLHNVAPVDEEPILTDNFLYNLMSVQKPDGTQFIPIFLNSHRSIDLIPTPLASSLSYVLTEPFDHNVGDMCNLYCLLTNQRRQLNGGQPGKVIAVKGRRTAFDIPPSTPSNHGYSELYKSLSYRQEYLTIEKLQLLSGHFAGHWQAIGESLGLNTREIQECLLKASSTIDSNKEACYLMLRFWFKEKCCPDRRPATVALLAHGVWNAGLGHLLVHIHHHC